jgi:hypothetical protein
MNTIVRYAGQALAYAAFIALVAFLATDPVYVHLPEDKALLKMSFIHAGRRVGECRKVTAEEMAKLAPNMRVAEKCPRERQPLLVELEFDGEVLYREALPPTGFWSDGAASMYKKFVIDPGQHELAIRMRDSSRSEGYDYETVSRVNVMPRQNFVIDFDNKAKAFVFK